jgi:tetratricopeptide (TPR) repeat protein/predicted Ser/Thr protein kinase
MIGHTLGHFRILEHIGAGGMGEVYRAHDQHLKRSVAIKVLHAGTLSNPDARHHFRKEALTLSKLNHPHIATVFDFDTQEGVDFLVMEYIAGINLRQLLKEGPLSQAEIDQLAPQLLEGLTAAHRQGVIHCDLKPENLRVTPEGQLKILDFGLAKFTRPAGDASTTLNIGESLHAAGTLPYMSPEQIRNQDIGAQSDIYAAGAVLYEMATGRRPHPEQSATALINAILHRDPEPPGLLNPKINRSLEATICKALQKDPAKRYQSAHDFLEDLTTGKVPRVRALRPRHRRVVALGASLAGCFLIAVGLWLRLHPRVQTFGERDWILITDVVNETADPIFDEALREAIAIDISQSKWLRVVSPQMTRNILQYMKRADAEFIDEGLGLEVCRRASVKVMLIPSIRQIGNALQVSARLVSAKDGLELSAALIMSHSRESILESGVDELVKTIRGDLGESLEAIQATDIPILQATTTSWEALRQYTIGKSLHLKFRIDDAKSHLEKAVELDSTFVLALSMLGIISAYEGDQEAAVHYHTRALRYSDNVSQRERLGTRVLYYLQVEHDPQKAVVELETCDRSYPGEGSILNNLSVIYREFFHDYVKAVNYAEQATKADPYSMVYYNAFGMAAIYAGYYDAVIENCRRQLKIDPEHVWAYMNLAEAYGSKGDLDAALVALRRGLEIDPTNFFGRPLEVDLLRLDGDVQGALAAMEKLEALNRLDPSDLYTKAALQMRLGEEQAAKATLDSLEKRTLESGMPPSEARRWRLLALAKRGQIDRAIQESQALEPSEDAVDLLTIARIHALAGMPAEAVAWLERAVAIRTYGFLEIFRISDFDLIRSSPQYLDFQKRRIKTRRHSLA